MPAGRPGARRATRPARARRPRQRPGARSARRSSRAALRRAGREGRCAAKATSPHASRCASTSSRESLPAVRRSSDTLPSGAHVRLDPVRLPDDVRSAPACIEGWRGPVLRRARGGTGRHDPALPSARSVLAELAGARARDHRQHRPRLPAHQQVLQPGLQRARPVSAIAICDTMLKTLRQIATVGIVSERRAAAGRAARRGPRSTAARSCAVLGRALCIRHVDAGSCNGCELEIHALNNPVLQPRGPRHPLRREPAPRRHAAGDRPGLAQHGGARCDAPTTPRPIRSSSWRWATAAAPAASSARATRAAAESRNVIPVDVACRAARRARSGSSRAS